MTIQYRPDIDGLRAVAVASVVFFHAFPQLVPGGFVGVDVFFVISGYLITAIILKDAHAGSFSLIKFYLRRARRVFPALLIVVTACLIFGWFVLLPAEFVKLGEHVAAAALFSANLLSWSDSGYFDVSAAYKPLLHLWSLGVEEQFYIIWPLLIAGLVGRRVIGLIVLAIIFALSLGWSIHSVLAYPTAAFYSPLSRAWELAAGGMVAWFYWKSSVKLPFVLADCIAFTGLGLLVYAFCTMSESAAFPGLNAVPPVLGTMLVIAANGQGILSRSLLGNKILVSLGLVSYPLYLWHWPLISFSHILLDEVPPLAMSALVALSVGLAVVTYLCVERPVRLRAGWRKLAPAIGTSGLAVAGLVGFSVFLLDGIPSRFPVEIQKVLSYGTYRPEIPGRHPSCWVFPNVPVKDFPAECKFSGSGKPKILVWGDSHAAMLYSGLKEVLGNDFDVAQFTRISCPPLVGFPGYCGEANVDMLSEIKSMSPDILLMFGAWPNYPGITPEYNQSSALAETMDKVMALGVPRVLVVGPSPSWTPFLPTQVYRTWVRDIPLRRIPERLAAGDTPAVQRWDAEIANAASVAGALYFSVRHNLCNDKGCLTHTDRSNHELLIFDNGHLTKEGAEMVVRQMAIERVFGEWISQRQNFGHHTAF